MNSCIGQILCLLADGYDGFLSPVCENPDLIVTLLRDSKSEIVEQYVEPNCKQADLEKSLDWLVQVTQDKFRARPSGQERAEAKIPEWVTTPGEAEKIIDTFSQLNFIAEKPPKHNHYSCAAVLGSTAPNMEKRIGYLSELIENKSLVIDKVFLLTGTRKVDSSKYYDGSESYLASVAQRFDIDKSEISEEHLMVEVYDRLCMQGSKCQKIEHQLVYAPKNKGRANTLDTLIEFSKFFNNKCPDVLYVSTAPFIVYQNEIIDQFTSSKSEYYHIYETIGGPASVKEAPNLAKAAHYLLMAFAESLHSAQGRIREDIKSLKKDEL